MTSWKLRIYRSKLAISRTCQMMETRDAPGLAAIGPWFCESKTLFDTSDQVFDCNASPLCEAPLANNRMGQKKKVPYKKGSREKKKAYMRKKLK